MTNSDVFSALLSAKSPYHVTDYFQSLFGAHGFQEFTVGKSEPEPGERFLASRGKKTICAWVQGADPSDGTVRLISAHTDFPALRVRNNSFQELSNCAVFDVDPYNGPLIDSWFDRDLRCAGVASVETGDGLAFRLVDLGDFTARLLSVAPHLSSGAEKKRPRTLRCVWASGVKDSRAHFAALVARAAGVSADQIVDWELWLTAKDAPVAFGADDPLVSTQAADNVLSCAVAAEALVASLDVATPWSRMIVFFDFEEVGSFSWSGAHSNFLPQLVASIRGEASSDQSMHVALDVSHALVDPADAEFDKFNMPLLGRGPALKMGSPGRYSHSLTLASALRRIARLNEVDLQSFMYPAGQRRGGSLSPYVAANLGVRTVDFGTPVVSMHSVRELYSSSDAAQTTKILTHFLRDVIPLADDWCD